MEWASFSAKYYTDNSWFASDYGTAQKIREALGFDMDMNVETDAVTKAIDATISSITAAIEELKPERVFICIDSGTSERKKIDCSYKRGRPCLSAEYWGMYSHLLQEINEILGDHTELTVSEGWEADDCMATIASCAVKTGRKSVLMTVDKDMNQCLVSGSVNIKKRCKDARGKPNWSFWTAADAEKAWQVPQDYFVALQALAGDATDRVAGCPNVGLITAAKLLIEYNGSLELMRKQDSFPIVNSRQEESLLKFFKNGDDVVSRKLVEMRKDLRLVNPLSGEFVLDGSL